MKKLFIAITLLALPLTSQAQFLGFSGNPNGTKEVKPGIFQTRIALEMASDTTFQHEAGLPLFLGAVQYTTTERSGVENACEKAKEQALHSAASTCSVKYAKCSVVTASVAERNGLCEYKITTRGEGMKRIKSASLEEQPDEDEIPESTDAA